MICQQCFTGALTTRNISCDICDPSPNNKEHPESSTRNPLQSQLLSQEMKCEKHLKKLKYVCWKDQEKICAHCAILDKYRDSNHHDIQPLSSLTTAIEPRLKCWEDLLLQVKRCQHDGEIKFEEQRRTTLKAIQSRFHELQFLLKAKETEFISDINSFYDKEIHELRSQIGGRSFLRRIIDQKIQEYQEITRSPEPFKLLEEDFSVIFMMIQDTLYQKSDTKIESMLRRIKEDLESILSRQLFICEKMKTGLLDPREKDLKLEDNLFFRPELEKYQNFLSPKSFIIKNDIEKIIAIQEKKACITYPFHEASLHHISLTENFEGISSLEFKISHIIKKVSQEELAVIRYIRSKLVNIQDIEITLEDSKISDEALLDIFSGIFWKNSILSSINLKFKTETVFEKSIIFLAEYVLPLTRNLKRFSLYCGKCEITPRACDSLNESLKYPAENLTYFYLDLKSKNVEASSLQKLFITQMPNMEFFSYKITTQEFNDKVLEILARIALPSMRKIENFHLIVNQSSVTDLSVRKFFKALPQNYSSTLKNLRIGLENTQITDESLKEFVEVTLPNMKALRTFEIFTGNTQASSSMESRINKSRIDLVMRNI